jgi:hypothetical protein
MAHGERIVSFLLAAEYILFALGKLVMKFDMLAVEGCIR